MHTNPSQLTHLMNVNILAVSLAFGFKRQKLKLTLVNPRQQEMRAQIDVVCGEQSCNFKKEQTK